MVTKEIHEEKHVGLKCSTFQYYKKRRGGGVKEVFIMTVLAAQNIEQM